MLEKYGEPCPEAMVESASKHIRILEDNDYFNLRGKKAFISGSTSGIGLATVKQLAKQSATIICASRNAELSRKIGAEITDKTSNKNIYTLQLELDL